MREQELKHLLDKVIGTKGNLHIPAYWMHRLLTGFFDKIKQVDDIQIPKNLSELNNDVSYISLYDVNSRINTVNNTINTLNSTLNQQITTVSNKATSNETKITNNTSAIQQINTTLANKADIISLPTKVSQLANDCAYLQDIKTGVYALTADGKLVGQDQADSTCKGVVLITPNQSIMISSRVGYQQQSMDYRSFNQKVALDNINIESIPDITQASDALLDFNGKQYTQALLEAYTDYCTSNNIILSQSAGYLMELIVNKDSTVYGIDYTYDDWYIPSLGQVYEVYLYHDAISAMYYKIYGHLHFASTHTILSTSEYSINQYWAFDFYKTEKEEIRTKDTQSSVFCVRDINVKSVQDRITQLENQVAALDAKIQELINNSTQ